MQTRRWGIAVGACVLLVLVLGGYKAWQIRQLMAYAASFPEPSETVEVHTVRLQPWAESIHSVGEVKAPQTVTLRNEVAGRVVAVGFAAGAAVHKDQLLVQLDASEEVAQLRAAEADAALAQQALERNRKLIGQKLTSQQEYDQAQAQRSVALARAEALRAVIAKKTLTAPFDAQAGLHTLQVGQFLAADTRLTDLVGVGQGLWVDFALPQQQSDVSVGDAVQVSVRGLVDTALAAQVLAVDATVSTASRNRMVRAGLAAGATPLKPGMLVDVSLTRRVSAAAVVVPDTAVLHDLQGSHVFVLVKDAAGVLRAQRRAVTVNGEHAHWMRISEGLQTGEQIAANGAYKLQAGLRTNARPESAPSDSAPLGNTPLGNTPPKEDAAP